VADWFPNPRSLFYFLAHAPTGLPSDLTRGGRDGRSPRAQGPVPRGLQKKVRLIRFSILSLHVSAADQSMKHWLSGCETGEKLLALSRRQKPSQRLCLRNFGTVFGFRIVMSCLFDLFHQFSVWFHTFMRQTKGVFIATQLNSTRRRVELRRYRRVSIATQLNSTQLTKWNSVQPSQSCFCLW